MAAKIANLPDFIAPKVAAEIAAWLQHLGAERRMSPKTLEAYRRDVLQFLAFLAEHLGGAPSLKELAALSPADVRAFLAARRADDIGSRSLMRSARRPARLRPLSGEERQGQGRRARRRARAEDRQDLAAAAGGATPPRAWPIRISPPATAASRGFMPATPRCSALLYGCGLRISEALGLNARRFRRRATRSR